MATSGMISVRMPRQSKLQLDAAAAAAGESRSALVQRYVEEGLRMDRHAGIVFRPGPAGRRAALAGGPDVWEVIRVVRNVTRRGAAAIAETARWLALTPAQVDSAVGYYADFKLEIDDWLARVDRAADEAEATWRRQQEVCR